MENKVAVKALIEVLQGAEIALAENDGYDLCKPLGVRVAINSLLAGLGVEPKDLEGETGTTVDAGLVAYGRLLAHACDNSPLTAEQAKERARQAVDSVWSQLASPSAATYHKLVDRVSLELMAVAAVPSPSSSAEIARRIAEKINDYNVQSFYATYDPVE